MEVIKLSGSKTNRDNSRKSRPDSIPETHKNGVQPRIKSNFNRKTKAEDSIKVTDSSDESAASSLIP